MLIYHPAFDNYSCAFRILLLTSRTQMDMVEVERLRIWDFYLVFPGEAKNITFPMELSELKRIFKSKPNPYEDLIDSKRIFERMKPFQLSALKYLSAYGFIDSDELVNNNVKRTEKEIPQELVERMNTLSVQQDNILKLITSPLNNLPLYGDRGFKYRTKLIDFKYDVS